MSVPYKVKVYVLTSNLVERSSADSPYLMRRTRTVSVSNYCINSIEIFHFLPIGRDWRSDVREATPITLEKVQRKRLPTAYSNLINGIASQTAIL